MAKKFAKFHPPSQKVSWFVGGRGNADVIHACLYVRVLRPFIFMNVHFTPCHATIHKRALKLNGLLFSSLLPLQELPHRPQSLSRSFGLATNIASVYGVTENIMITPIAIIALPSSGVIITTSDSEMHPDRIPLEL